jgi:hypothetical protein
MWTLKMVKHLESDWIKPIVQTPSVTEECKSQRKPSTNSQTKHRFLDKLFDQVPMLHTQ